MVPTAALWQLVEVERITVVWTSLERVRGLYIVAHKLPVIVLDSSILVREAALRTVLAHELGHHFATATTKLHGIEYQRAEHRANAWAARFLLPPDMLERQLREGVDVATENAVEPWLVDIACRMYWPQIAA